MRVRRELSDLLRHLGSVRPASSTAFEYHPCHGDSDAPPNIDGFVNEGDGVSGAHGTELHLAVLAVLRPAILVGDLPDGIRLIEEEVASHLGVSRGPVREALGILRDEGLVMIAPRRGAIVTGLRPDDIDDLYDLRIVLECHAIRRAAAAISSADVAYLRRLDGAMVSARRPFAPTDIAFHRHILVVARQERLLAAWERIAGIVGGLLAVTDTQRPDLVRHANLIAALEDHDGETASALMHIHIRNAHRIMRGVLAAR
jgi:DNA-binding GntR family transcriptional regulator